MNNLALRHQNKDVAKLIAERNGRRTSSIISLGANRTEQKLKRRYGTDERGYADKNKVWKRIAVFISFFSQFIFFASASYFVYGMMWEPTFAGVVNTFGGVGFIGLLAYVQYLTSDGFHDRMARGEFNIGFFVLNFIVIWGAVVCIAMAGTFIYGQDTKSDPQLYDNPNVAAIRADIAANNEHIAMLEAKNKAFDTDPKYKVKSGSDKGVVRHTYQQQQTANSKTISTLTAANATLASTLSTQYNVSASIDVEGASVHAAIENSKIYIKLGMVFLLLVAFEVARWYDSKYNERVYADGVLSGKFNDPGYLRELLGK